MIRSLAFNLYFYLGTLLVAVIGILLVPIPTPVCCAAYCSTGLAPSSGACAGSAA